MAASSPPPFRRQSWAESFAMLQSYVSINGTPPPSSYVAPDGYNLGIWVREQRVYYRRGRLSAEFVEQLERVPGWTWNGLDEAWSTRYSQLQRFVEQYAELPTVFRTDDIALARWLRAQCAAHEKGKLASGRVALLEQLPGWTWDFDAAEWNTLYSELRIHLDKTGMPPAPTCLSDNAFRIGAWAKKQRKLYLAGHIANDRARQLEQLLGWPWAGANYDAGAEQAWNTSYLALRRYVAEHGKPPPRDYVTASGFWLGPWAAAQRASHAANVLRGDRVRRLEQIPAWTWRAVKGEHSLKGGWESRFNHLARYVEQHGTMPLTVGDTAQGAWVAQQRIAYKKGRLARDRIELLESLTGWTWDARASAWDAAYGALQQYISENNALPRNFFVTPGGLRIGQWINVQRVSFKRGKLSAERIARLEQLDGWTWGGDPRFDDACAAFLKYYGEHRSCPRTDFVTDQGFGLGAWVSRQRRDYRHGRLDADRRRRLEQLGLVA